MSNKFHLKEPLERSIGFSVPLVEACYGSLLVRVQKRKIAQRLKIIGLSQLPVIDGYFLVLERENRPSTP